MHSRAFVLITFLTLSAHAQLPSYSEPSLSPSGEIAFVSGGDIWTVPLSGGDARLLVSNPASESRPIWSPDGKQLAFVSTRTGNGDIYVLDLAGGATRRITYDDVLDRLDAWSRDGKWLYFESTSRDISAMNDIYRVASTGGTPMQVVAERYVNEFQAAPSPDGNRIAIGARGIGAGQWWRHGHSHIDDSQIWIVDPSSQKYEAVTADGARELWPMWSHDGKSLWYASDRGGPENIWSITPGGQPAQITKFTTGRVVWPSISYDGRTIVFERDFGIWKLDTASGSTSEVKIARLGSPSVPAIEHRKLSDRFTDFALSPDGKKVAFVARGEVWAASAKEGGDAVRITNTSAAEAQVAWSPDSKSIVYTSDSSGTPHLCQYDFANERESELTNGDLPDFSPSFSPDGKLLAFQRGKHELEIYDVASKQLRSVAKGSFDGPPLGSERTLAWSPDSKWIAYLTFGADRFRNAYVVSAAGGDGKPVSFLANVFADALSWSRDGKFLLMSTSQRTENGQIARIDLVPQTPKFREEQFRELFQKKPEEKKDEEKKVADVAIEFAGIRERLRLLPIGLDAGENAISPDGKWVAFIADTGDDENVYVYSIDELANEPAPAKQLSATSGRKRALWFSPDNKEVWYLDGGRIASATIDPVKAKTLGVTAEMDVDFLRERDEAFRQGWTWLRDNFFDAKMNGVDWNAMRERFAPRVAAASTPDEFRRLMGLMIGELNASHSGANPPRGSSTPSTGRIGVRFDRAAYEKDGTLRVSEVIPLSPADVAKIKAGDVITAIDRAPIGNFDQSLEYKTGKRTVITLTQTGVSVPHDVIVQPISGADEKQLTYRAWVNANRDYVDRVSNHRIGYVHMIDMGFESLQRLFVDLDAENRARDGVVIDVRNNNGGFVNVYAIDVLARRSYLNMTFRDEPAAPARSILGQRALEKPTVLVINRHSLSDAEDFTEGYRSLGLGKIVGEPTAGWIIYTGDVPLIDGTQLRMPHIRITDTKGQDMEMNPRPVDIFVQRPIGESFAGKDSQLDTAVQTLLLQLK